ncbi:MAG: GPR1/FUN34/YaaH family transporter [Deltaproteobacteria bacterium]|nr:GPR1/FUN34/YaaH family transporter [Deltaproteobacteria bacterium]
MEQQHSFATPGPAALGAFAVAVFGFGAVFLGKIGVNGLPLLAAWLVGGGIIQLTAGIMELKDHNVTGGNVFLYFSGFFMFAAALSTIAKFLMITNGITPEPTIEGWTWLAGFGFLVAMTPAYAKANAALFVLVVAVDVALFLIALIDLGMVNNAICKPIVGYLLLFTGCIALYLIAATATNSVYGRTVLPVPKPLVK